MFGNRAYLDEAIADAEKLVQMTPDVAYCVVTRPHGQFRAVRRHFGIDKSRIKWRSWRSKPHAPVKNTPENKKIIAENCRKMAARIIGCSVSQIDYAVTRYGWRTMARGTVIDIAEMAEAMKTMTARQYAEQLGVYPERIYKLCRRHGIERPVRAQRGRRS